MKKVLGILLLSVVCILLGLSVGWSREQDVTLVSACESNPISVVMQ